MKISESTSAVSPHLLSRALASLKVRLQHDYEEAYPALGEIIHLVLDVEETRAWELSAFPHLLLPDLVEAHVAKLNLPPVDTTEHELPVPHDFTPMQMPHFAAA